MANLVSVENSGKSTLRSIAKDIGTGVATTAGVIAVAGAVFLMIAASVNPITTPGLLGTVAMGIAKAPYLKTLVYIYASITVLVMGMISCFLFKAGLESSTEFWKKNWQPEIFADKYVHQDGTILNPLVRSKLKYYLNFLKSNGRDVDANPTEFTEITKTNAYIALRFGNLNSPGAKPFQKLMNEKASLPRSESSFLLGGYAGFNREELDGLRAAARDGKWPMVRGAICQAHSS